jgi:outer membrane protein
MKTLKLIASAFAFVALLAASDSFSADFTPATVDTKNDGKGAIAGKVAYVDLVKIVAEAKAADSIEKQVEKLKEKYQADAKSKETALKAREKELSDQKKVLSPEAFEKKVVEFRKRVMTDQEQVGRYQQILQTAYLKALEALKIETVKAVGIYSRENNISLVMPKSQLLYGFEAFDITDNILQLLNDKVPDIKITVDEKAKEAPKESSKEKPKSQKDKK